MEEYLSSTLQRKITTFVEMYAPKEPLIIAFSGGPDSTALLYSLLPLGRSLHAVYVDHGWRAESKDEVAKLQQQVEPLGISFHSFSLPPYPGQENLEEWSRRKRYECLQQAARSVGTKFILLGHQADDQIEIVMKRVLEGSSVINFRGMKAVEERNGITLLRPLLPFRRQEVLKWLQLNGISFLEDPSNSNERFLRARMRKTIFPFLRTSFGKDFEESLSRVSEEAAMLEEFAHDECAKRSSILIARNCAFAFAKNGVSDVPPFLAQVLLDKIRRQISFGPIPRSCVMEAIQTFCRSPSKPKQFELGNRTIFAEYRFFALFNEKPSVVKETTCSGEGSMVHAGYHFSWKETTFQGESSVDWTDLFCGKTISLHVPLEQFTVSRGSDRLLRDIPQHPGAFAPAFLRPYLPTLVQKEKVVADLLRGYRVDIERGALCTEVKIKAL